MLKIKYTTIKALSIGASGALFPTTAAELI